MEATIVLKNDDSFDFSLTEITTTHDILVDLKSKSHPGLVLFSSGSTGKSKAAVHDFLPLLNKFKVERKCMKMVTIITIWHSIKVLTSSY